MKKLLIDCDPGIDDTIAMALALGAPELDVIAITAVTGNLTADRTSVNARKVLEFLGHPGIPVAQGRLTPLARPYPRDPFSHGDDGLGNYGLPEPTMPLDDRGAAQMIVDTVNAHAGDISIAALGPLTNIAEALEIDPELPSKVTEIYAVAGAFGFTPYAWTQATGDNPVSEWNVFVDPEAAKRVFEAGFEFTAVSLDVTTHARMNLSDAQLQTLAASGTRGARLLVEFTEFVRVRGYQSYCALIDSLVIGALIDPSLVTTQRVLATVETQGEATLGMTVADLRKHHAWKTLPHINATSDADFDRYFEWMIAGLTR